MPNLHIVSILDRSGSMGGSEIEVINAYNNLIKEQEELVLKNGIDTFASLILFDNTYRVVYQDTPIMEVPVLTKEIYFIGGMTALYDAIGKTINSFEGKEKVIFFIETDGFENSSKEFTRKTIKDLIDKKTKDGWDFTFVGADLSSADVNNISASIGIDKSFAFDKTSIGYANRNATLSANTQEYLNMIDHKKKKWIK